MEEALLPWFYKQQGAKERLETNTCINLGVQWTKIIYRT